MNPLRSLREALDERVAGQEQAKEALILAVLARQHVYLEGPPGCGKSLLAAELAHHVAAEAVAVSLHRDTRRAELLGETALRRRRVDGGERLSEELRPGALLTARVVLIDDLFRAPPTLLASLLRLLSERRWEGRALALETAVATATPGPAVSAAALDSLLDGFGFQIRLSGLVAGGDWSAARRLLDATAAERSAPRWTPALRAELQQRARRVEIGRGAREAWWRLARRWPDAFRGLSDRRFSRVLADALRAHAFWRGRERADAADLRVLRYLLGRRLDAETAVELERSVEEIACELGEAPPAGRGQGRAKAAGWGGSGSQGAEPVEILDLALPRNRIGPSRRTDPVDVGLLLRALRGTSQRGSAQVRDDPGGAPRQYRELRRLDELADADPVDAALFAEARLPERPRVHRRQRRDAAGELALLRDVSASMEGRLHRWAAGLADALVRYAARRRSRVAYVEFDHRARRYRCDSRFLHRGYARLLGQLERAEPGGRTNYQAPLRAALEELEHAPGADRQVVMLTDGLPVAGDPEVIAERRLARRLGVRVHTVFVGLGPCPPVLDRLSRETGGRGFLARPGPGGGMGLRERPAAAGARA